MEEDLEVAGDRPEPAPGIVRLKQEIGRFASVQLSSQKLQLLQSRCRTKAENTLIT